jgi:dUTP pyrophosphatase
MAKIDVVGNVPLYAQIGDAGADLISTEELTLTPGQTKLVKTGTSVAIPESMVGMVCSRSGLAAKNAIFVLNAPGIIDSGYRGEIGVVLHNAGEEWFAIKPGDRIAQLVFVRHVVVDFNQVESLDETERGDGGFGSTGV